MLQSCKSMFCYIELTLISLIDGVCNGRLQNAPTQHTLKVIDYHSNQVECCTHWLIR